MTPLTRKSVVASLIGAASVPWVTIADAGPFNRRDKICDKQSGICLVLVERTRDSDGDGFTDADEIAAGTDPHNRHSSPAILDILRLAGQGKLPSFENHQSIVAILPTATPDGRPIKTGLPDKASIPAFGGVKIRDVRANALKAMGLSDDTLKGAGVNPGDLSNGLSIGRGGLPGSKLPQIGTGSQTFAFGNVKTSLIAEGTTTGLVANGARATDSGPNVGKHATGVYEIPNGFGTTFGDGSRDEYSQTYNKDRSYREQRVSWDEAGNFTGSYNHSSWWEGDVDMQSYSSVAPNSDGGNTAVNVQVGITVDENLGSKSTTTTVTVTTTDAEGNETTQKATQTNTYDSSGNVTGTTTTAQTCTKAKDGAETCTPTTATNKYVNVEPGADTGVVYITPELMKRVLLRPQTNSTPGPDGKPQVDKEALNRPTPTDLIALYDERSNRMVVLVEPSVWNKSQGTMRFVPGFTPGGQPNAPLPSQDPTFAHPAISSFASVLSAMGDIPLP